MAESGRPLSDRNDHDAAAATFAARVRERPVSALEALYLFGSTARGEATGLDSDVDFLAVVADAADRTAVVEELRDIASDVLLLGTVLITVQMSSPLSGRTYVVLPDRYLTAVFGFAYPAVLGTVGAGVAALQRGGGGAAGDERETE